MYRGVLGAAGFLALIASPAQAKTVTISKTIAGKIDCCSIMSRTNFDAIQFENGDTLDITLTLADRAEFTKPLSTFQFTGIELYGGTLATRITNPGSASYELLNALGDYAVAGSIAVTQGVGYLPLPVAVPGQPQFGSFEGIHIVAQISGNVDPRVGQSISGVQLFFNTRSAVPEPATWALMIGGFGLVGAATRARRKTRSRFATAPCARRDRLPA